MRRTKLNKDLIKEAEELLKDGHYAQTVAGYLGICEQTWYNWYNNGEKLAEMDEDELDEALRANKHNELYLEFFETVKRATNRAEIEAVRVIKKASEQSWQASAWYLERKFRERWGRVTADHQGDGDKDALDKFLNQVDNIAQEESE